MSLGKVLWLNALEMQSDIQLGRLLHFRISQSFYYIHVRCESLRALEHAVFLQTI